MSVGPMGDAHNDEMPILREDERFLIHMMAVVEAARTSLVDRRLKSVGLTTPAIRALAWIKASPGATMSELAAGVFTDRTTLTRTVDTLVREGLARRAGDAADRRKVALELTPAGEEVCRIGHRLIDEVGAAMAGLLDKETVRQMNRALMKAHKAFVEDERIRDVHTGRAAKPPASD